mmetsp:Transcript_5432/g.13650  ORF Transcript_5432/g.13650 Transcript_5432/m.13650 type:complete len:286 (+) Transcript_5432:126-983(+)
MFNPKSITFGSIFFLFLNLDVLIASAFQILSRDFRLSRRPLSFSLVYLRSFIKGENEQNRTLGTGSRYDYSIHLADDREKVLQIKLYRFGGPNVEEHMKSNPDLPTRKDALRSLTSYCDDRGVQKLFYGNGDTGESVQFFALGHNVSSLFPATEPRYKNTDLSLTCSHVVLGSVDAAQYTRQNGNSKQVEVELKNLSVHKSVRRSGIGRALTEAVQNYVCDQVCSRRKKDSNVYDGIIHLLVESDNEAAMTLYKKTGFVEIEPKSVPLSKLTWTPKRKHYANIRH